MHLIHYLLGVLGHGDSAAGYDFKGLADALIHLVMLSSKRTEQLVLISECAFNKSLLERAEVDFDHIEHGTFVNVAQLFSKVLERFDALL